MSRNITSRDVPQAPDLSLIRRLVDAVDLGANDAESLQKTLAIERRRTQYYVAAASRALGLISERGGSLELSALGRRLVETTPGTTDERHVLADAIRSSAVIKALAGDLLGPRPPALPAISARAKRLGLAEATARQRARQILGWRETLLSPHQEPLGLEETSKNKCPIKNNADRADPPTVARTRARLTGLELHGFKGFAHASLPLGGFTVLVGTNAAGKSNIRDALRFLHGIARGYTLPETIGEKWVEGGVLQWTGLRGGTREVGYQGQPTFSVEAHACIRDRDKDREAVYRIEVSVGDDSTAPRVVAERLTVSGRGQYIFDSHPDAHAPRQQDPLHLAIRLKKEGKKGYIGPEISVINNRPALTQIPEHQDAKPKEVRDLCLRVIDAFASMQFLDLSPDPMRRPSFPGQVVLGDRGENLSSVLQAICAVPSDREGLISWIRELTPLDVVDLEFPSDQTGRILVALVEDNGRRTSAHSASDGTLRFLAMIAAFLGPGPAHLYFFEELETGLHPTRLHLLLDLIEHHTRRGASQVIATTHSPQLLAFLSKRALEDAVLAYRLPGETDQKLVRILSIPEAQRVLASQDVATLFRTGWLEDAVAFSSEADAGDQRK